MEEIDYFKYPVNTDTTLEELTSDEKSVFKNYKNKLEELLSIKDSESDISNLDRIWNNYTDEQRDEYTEDYISSSLSVVNNGTILLLQKSETPLNLVAITGENLFLEDTTFKGFWTKAFRELNNNSDYIPSEFIGNNIIKQKQYNISVWVYIRALDLVKDITDFVYSMDTQSTMGGGSFSLTLDGFNDFSDISSINGENTISYTHADGDKINIPYFTKYLQQKDVVFLRYEKLELEKNSRQDLRESEYSIPKQELASRGYNPETESFDRPKVYDMIGLITDIQESYSAFNNDVMINISGQDLSMMLTDDAAYFYPIMFAEDSELVQIDTTDNSDWFKRNFITGEFENFFNFGFRSIKDSIGFVVNQLSNLGIVPDDLFSGYNLSNSEDQNDVKIGERRNQIVRINGDNNKTDSQGRTVTPYLEWTTVKGIWQIIDVLVDDNISDRRQANGLLVKGEGTLMSFMDDICQTPLVEFFTDTYGDKFQFIAREQPFRKEAIRSYLLENSVIEINNEDLLSTNLMWENEFYTWYQIQANNNFMGYKESDSIGYLPIVYLPTYAEKFGNHRYVISDGYISNDVLEGDKQNKRNYDRFRESILNDLIRVIDMTSYLPFTRKGSITINGDRRIKKGTFIRLNPTGEIYYVDSVSNNFTASRNQIDRTTTIQVSRGMIEKYVFDTTVSFYQDGETKTLIVSYFNIVETNKIRDLLVDTIPNQQGEDSDEEVEVTSRRFTTKANFDVNKDMFNFFFERKQMLDVI